MLTPLIRRQFALTAVIFVASLAGAHLLSRLLSRMDHMDFLKNHADVALYALSLAGEGRIETARRIREINEHNQSPIQIDLVRDNRSLLTGEEFHSQHVAGPRPPERLFAVPDDPATQLLVRLGPPPGNGGPLTMTLFLFGAILLASFASAALLFWRFRDKAEMAKSVLGRIQHGDLKARFPISKWEDASQILTLFNTMADEIERLVNRLRRNERSRMEMLGDIAHDLRTPIASLRTAIEGLDDRHGAVSRAVMAEFTQMAVRETEYLERLVEDLLFLAVMFEPKYRSAADNVAPEAVIRSQLPAVAAKYPGIQWSVEVEPGVENAQIGGDPHLLARLMRNALENAFSFARGRVTTELRAAPGGGVTVRISDDGPGFSAEALLAFGTKRTTRYLAGSPSGTRLSVGLGSVIMKAIVAAHAGSLEPANVLSPSGATIGARVTLAFTGSRILTAA